MRLVELLKEVENASILGENVSDVEILSLSSDSRQKVHNGLFFCIKGKNTDSHECVYEAVRNGTIAIVTERKLDINVLQILVEDTRKAIGFISAAFYGYPSKQLKMIGVTGTNGKTTTAYLLASILEKANKKVGIIGTLGIVYANQTIPTDLTTPDPILLQKTLAQMLAFGV